MADTDDLIALQQAAQSVHDMRERLERISDPPVGYTGTSDRIATTEVRQDCFYWVILGQNPPEIATGSAASGGWPVIPSRGTQRQ